MLTLEDDGTMADCSNADVHFLNKPLYFWTKSFADTEIKRDESFSKFLSTNALNHALEYIGIGNENEQSSLHLSAIFDEENTGQWSLGSSSSRTSKLVSQAESDTKARIQALSHVFNELKAYFEDHFSQLVLIRPPNAVHVATSCHHCCVDELEKVLLLLLGASVQGVRKQDTIRKIKGFPKPIQQELIQAIKNATENPELLHVKPWAEYCTLESAAQHRVYDNLLCQLRRLLAERNDVIRAQLLSDYSYGFTSCDQKRSYELAKESGSLMDSFDMDKYSDENRASAAIRQLRLELLEKSDLLQECREELEMTKGRVQELQHELSDTLKDLRSCKKSRDEFDVLREGQEKSLRLEAELRRMKKKLEESEQYYERVEILQNENRNHQRKHAILMDQINMLTVEKERLEVSFLTQQNNRSLSGHFSQDELEDGDWNLNRTENRFEDELILDTTEESDKADSRAPAWTELLPTPTLTPSPSPTPPILELELIAAPEPVVVEAVVQVEVDTAEPLAETPSTNQDSNETSELPPPASSPCPVPKEEEDLEPETLVEAEVLGSSSGSTQLAEITEEEIQEEAIVPEQQDQEHRASDKRRWKGGRRRGSSLYVKRTRKSLPGTSKVVLNKVTALLSTENLDQIPHKQQVAGNHSLSPSSSTRKSSGHIPRGGHRIGHRRRRSEDGKQVVPTVDMATDADAELSMSPTVHRYFSSSSGSDAEILGGSHQSSGRRTFLKRGSPSRRVPLSRKLPSNAWITPGNRSPIPPPEELYHPIHDSDNELFFVCSTTQPATARNVKISKGRQIPLVQMVNNNITEPRRMDERLEIIGGQSVVPSESGMRRADEVAETISRCNIQVSLRQVNRNSHHLSLGRDENEGLEGMLDGHQPALPRGAFSHPVNLAWSQSGRDVGGSPVNNSSSEDDESVWYEYGCV